MEAAVGVAAVLVHKLEDLTNYTLDSFMARKINAICLKLVEMVLGRHGKLTRDLRGYW
jgi:hypothetical protein